MRTPTLLLTLPFLAAAQTYVVYQCPGELYDSYCCVDGSWSGPVITSFYSVQSVVAASIDSVQASLASQREASLSSKLATRTFGPHKRALITPAPVKREVISEAAPGLTCIGAGVVTMNQPGADAAVASITATAHSTYTGKVGFNIVDHHTLAGGNNAWGAGTLGNRDSLTTSTTSPSTDAAATTTGTNGVASAQTSSASVSTGVSKGAAAPMVTSGPALVLGGAALAFAAAVL